MKTIDGPVAVGVNSRFIAGEPDAKPLYYEFPGQKGKHLVDEVQIIGPCRFAAVPSNGERCASVRLMAESILVRE